MAYTPPTTEPREFRLGDTFLIDRDLGAYPAPTWTATLYIRGLTVASVSGAANGALHRFTFSAATTANWTIGHHGLLIRVTDGSVTLSLDEWHADFLPNFSALTSTYDARSFWRKLVDDVQDVLAGRAAASHLSYAFGSRSGSFIPHGDLKQMLAFAENRLKNEENLEAQRRGAANTNQCFAKFIST